MSTQKADYSRFKGIGISLVTLMAVIILAGSARAQNLQAGIDFTTMIPQKEFKDNVNNNGYGVTGHFGYNIANSPLVLGGEFGYVVYGTESYSEPLSSSLPVYVDVTTRNNILSGHLFARVQPRSGKVRPYAEALFGFKHLYTQTTVTDDYYDDTIASEKDFGDSTSSYGAGGGVMFLLHESRKSRRSTTPNFEILLDAKVRYMRGGFAEYLRKGSIYRSDTTYEYDVYSSRTDNVSVHVGLTFRF
jgi:hypothetical protein